MTQNIEEANFSLQDLDLNILKVEDIFNIITFKYKKSLLKAINHDYEFKNDKKFLKYLSKYLVFITDTEKIIKLNKFLTVLEYNNEKYKIKYKNYINLIGFYIYTKLSPYSLNKFFYGDGKEVQFVIEETIRKLNITKEQKSQAIIDKKSKISLTFDMNQNLSFIYDKFNKFFSENGYNYFDVSHDNFVHYFALQRYDLISDFFLSQKQESNSSSQTETTLKGKTKQSSSSSKNIITSRNFIEVQRSRVAEVRKIETKKISNCVHYDIQKKLRNSREVSKTKQMLIEYDKHGILKQRPNFFLLNPENTLIICKNCNEKIMCLHEFYMDTEEIFHFIEYIKVFARSQYFCKFCSGVVAERFFDFSSLNYETLIFEEEKKVIRDALTVVKSYVKIKTEKVNPKLFFINIYESFLGNIFLKNVKNKMKINYFDIVYKNAFNLFGGAIYNINDNKLITFDEVKFKKNNLFDNYIYNTAIKDFKDFTIFLNEQKYFTLLPMANIKKPFLFPFREQMVSVLRIINNYIPKLLPLAHVFDFDGTVFFGDTALTLKS